MRLKHAADGGERGPGWKMMSHIGVLMTQRRKERGDETETCCPVGREECVSQRCLMTPQRWKKEVVRLKHAVLWGGKNVSHSGVYNDATTLEERR